MAKIKLSNRKFDSVHDGYRVSGRGELHLSILLENMRREGYEVAVSKPQVLMKNITRINRHLAHFVESGYKSCGRIHKILLD